MLVKGEDNLDRGFTPDVFDAAGSATTQSQPFYFTGNKEDYISLTEAAKYTKFTQEYLSLMARTGRVAAQKFGRNWKVRMKDVEAYIAAADAKTFTRSETNMAVLKSPGSFKKIAEVSAGKNRPDDYFFHNGLTNFYRRKFQTVMASFLIIAITATSTFAWSYPAQVTRAEMFFQNTLGAAAQSVREAFQTAGFNIKETAVNVTKAGGRLLVRAEQSAKKEKAGRFGSVEKIGALVLLGLEAFGGVMNSWSAALERRTVKRQRYIATVLSRSVDETVYYLDALSADVRLAVKQTIFAPLHLIPQPVVYILRESTNSTEALMAAGAQKLQTKTYSLGNSGGGAVAGILEYDVDEEPFAKQAFSLAAGTARKQKALAVVVQKTSNDFISNISYKQQALGASLLETVSGSLARARGYVAKKIAGGNGRVAGIQESASDSATVWQRIDKNLDKFSAGVEDAKMAWRTEEVNSQSSLNSLWIRTLDLILPDVFRQKAVTAIAQTDVEQAPSVIERTLERTVVVTSPQKVVSPPVTQAPPVVSAQILKELAIDKILGNTEVTGNLTVAKDLLVQGELSVAGRLNFSGSLTVDDSADITNY